MDACDVDLFRRPGWALTGTVRTATHAMTTYSPNILPIGLTDTLEKDESIIRTLHSLRERFGDALMVVDHWDADLVAVGVATLASARPLVYFSTWKREPGRYYVDLEWPAAPNSDQPYEQGEKFEDVDFETLISIVARHLDLR